MPIRIANDADMQQIMMIERTCYPNPWPLILFQGHLGEAGFLIFEEKLSVVGYIVVGIKIPTLFERLEKRTKALMGQDVSLEEQTGHLMNIAVDPHYRRQGIARRLMDRGLEYLNELEADCVELEVRMTNIEAIELYHSYDFEIVGRVRNYYQDGEDAHFMRKVLQSPH